MICLRIRAHGDGLDDTARARHFFDDFIRTTEPRHCGRRTFLNAVKASGDIYEGTYEGLYWVEALKPKRIGRRQCPLHPNKPLDKIKEKFFFKLAYREELLKLYGATSS